MNKSFSIEYSNAALREISQQWHHFNLTLFAKTLKVPTLNLHKGESRLGYWAKRERIISISEDTILTKPWYKVLMVLQHEMAHQFIDEVMNCPESQPHGELFKSVCTKFGIEQEDETEIQQLAKESPVIDKIRKLLSLAQSSNVNEAENAMKLANELMLKWNVKHIVQSKKRKFKYIQLGLPGNVSLLKKMISQILTDFFFVETIWVNSYNANSMKNGRVLEVCGNSENLEIASYVYDYLNTVAQIQWSEYKIMNKGANRSNYQYGLMLGFHEKLKDQQEINHEEKSLIWMGDPLLDEYFRKRHPRVRKMGSSSLRRHEQSLNDGLTDGKKIVISKGIVQNENKGRFLSRG
jgi:hypothetical protein